jgi:hypothetical protein
MQAQMFVCLPLSDASRHIKQLLAGDADKSL